jgi:hypothetical protein
VYIWRGKSSWWGAFYILSGALVMAIFSSVIFSKAALAPDDAIHRNNSVLSYKMITTSAPIAQRNSEAQAITNDLESGSSILNLAPIHVGLANSSSPQLRKLAEYEKSAGGVIASGMLIFTDTPTTNDEANANAQDVGAELKEFAKFGIKPVIIMEPTTNNGPLDYAAFSHGHYDPALRTLFGTLKKMGINDSSLGTWVPFAEGNTPLWGNTDPVDFATNVTRTVQTQKQFFPSSQASILLNSQTYNSSDINWENGKFSSLIPYVQTIPNGLLNSIGLQGFPWAPPANDSGVAIFNAKDFLPTNLAEDAARFLGIQQIWFNTGTFGRNYTNDRAKMIKISAGQRRGTLSSVIQQSKKLQQDGFNVAINLFTADKSSLDEATDWSYWNEDNFADNLADQSVFTSFAKQTRANSIELWLFDSFTP